eukprot:1196125-Pyramimonas_sp.AAC.1
MSWGWGGGQEAGGKMRFQRRLHRDFFRGSWFAGVAYAGVGLPCNAQQFAVLVQTMMFRVG